MYYIDPFGFTTRSYAVFYYVYMLALSLVFLVEMRVRHEEVRGVSGT